MLCAACNIAILYGCVRVVKSALAFPCLEERLQLLRAAAAFEGHSHIVHLSCLQRCSVRQPWRPSSDSCVISVATDQKYAVVALPSGEQRSVLSHCTATIGAVSNPQHKNTKLGKAGASRWLGRRPVVRGMAMNPVDHPHGGGRGKRKGRISQTPWGVPTKGYRTRKTTRTTQYIRLSRHKAS